MLYYAIMPSPLGTLWLGQSERGLCRIALGTADAAGIAEEMLHDPVALAEPLRQLQEYFDGRRRVFALSLDLSAGSAFQQRVWRAAQQIPYGQTWSYGQLAAAVGRPNAARAVGRALGANPLPIVVPCHRVLRADGAWGGFALGLAVKRALLQLEGYPSSA